MASPRAARLRSLRGFCGRGRTRSWSSTQRVLFLSFYFLLLYFYHKRTFISWIAEVEAVIPGSHGFRKQVIKAKKGPLGLGSEEANAKVPGGGGGGGLKGRGGAEAASRRERAGSSVLMVFS